MLAHLPILLLLSGSWMATPASGPDLSSPRRALSRFYETARSGDYGSAAQVLDLRLVPKAQRADAGPRLARELMFVLDEQLWIDWEKISDEPEGSQSNGPNTEVLGSIPIDGAEVAIRLIQAEGIWRFGPGLVAAVPQLYARYGPGWFGDHLPPALFSHRFLEIQAWQWIGLALGAALALFTALGIGGLLRAVALRIVQRTRVAWDDALVKEASGPARLLLGLATFAIAVWNLRLSLPAREPVWRTLHVLAIAALAWAAVRSLHFAADILDNRLTVKEQRHGVMARNAKTRIMVLRRVLVVVILVVSGALVLLQFEQMRSVGASVLASAGVLGIIVGFAAQRSLGMLLAGIQISLTQPVRVGDVVVIEGEWGNIEEITLTYVVVRIWDQRRLVIPITRILESSFQNWSRSSEDILGTVFIHADYRVPVGAVRAEVERFVRTRSEWDGKVVGLQVTDVTANTIQLRALVSSADSSTNWDLRCALREQLIAFLQQLDDGAYLPRSRVELSSPPKEPGAEVVSAPT